MRASILEQEKLLIPFWLCFALGMADRGKPKAELKLTDEERAALQRLTQRPRSARHLVFRARIVLRCVEGAPNTEVEQTQRFASELKRLFLFGALRPEAWPELTAEFEARN